MRTGPSRRRAAAAPSPSPGGPTQIRGVARGSNYRGGRCGRLERSASGPLAAGSSSTKRSSHDATAERGGRAESSLLTAAAAQRRHAPAGPHRVRRRPTSRAELRVSEQRASGRSWLGFIGEFACCSQRGGDGLRRDAACVAITAMRRDPRSWGSRNISAERRRSSAGAGYSDCSRRRWRALGTAGRGFVGDQRHSIL